MSAILKLELERAYRSKGLLISLIIGGMIGLVQFMVVVLPNSSQILKYFDGTVNTYPLSVFKLWLGVDDFHPYQQIYLTIFPILATLPYAVSYFHDRKGGYIKTVCTRTKRSHYLLAKYVATFVVGGTAVILPLAGNLLMTAAAFPSLVPVGNGLFALGGSSMFTLLFYTHPYGYTLIYFAMYFVYGGVFASMALTCTIFFDYSFFVIIFPFVIFYGFKIIAPYVNSFRYGNISPTAILSMTQPGSIRMCVFFGAPIVLGVISFGFYIWRGVKNDIL